MSESSVGRAAVSVGYLALTTSLGWSAHNALTTSRWTWGDSIVWGTSLLLVSSGFMLWHTSRARDHKLAWSIYWAWSFTFMGLAVAYQLAAYDFPWDGRPPEDTLVEAMRAVLVGHLAATCGYLLARRRDILVRGPEPTNLGDAAHTRRRLISLLLIHALVSGAFIALMGSAMINGRAGFSAQLVALSDIPGFGTIYFISTAGAIVLPAVAITLRRRGLPIANGWIVLALTSAAIVLNPFIGSRFLTGSLLVAVAAAMASSYWRRWIPLALVLGLVTVFPSLDIFRGNATGSSAIEISTPGEALVTFDFDAFEMLTREVSTGGDLAPSLPSTSELLVAPFLRWVPFVSDSVAGDASGTAVATATGMGYTNVSMPLWGEAHLNAGWVGLVAGFVVLGFLLRRVGDVSAGLFGLAIDAPVAALMIIVLRGSLYEVLGYLLLALAVGGWLHMAYQRDVVKPTAAPTQTDLPANPLRPTH